MTTDKWQMQEAKARFAELLDKAKNEGPQVMIWRGQETAVVVGIETWRDMEKRAGPKLNIKDWLLSPEARSDEFAGLIFGRPVHKRRPPPSLD